jgi:hypothetical protein
MLLSLSAGKRRKKTLPTRQLAYVFPSVWIGTFIFLVDVTWLCDAFFGFRGEIPAAADSKGFTV